MAFVLTVVYVILTILSPAQFGPEWANYHVLTYLAGITFLLSLPSVLSYAHLRSSIQTVLLLCFILAIAFSEIANGWFGGIVASWKTFLPSAGIFFLIVINVTTIRRLKVITLAAVATCLVVVVEALCGYYGGFRGETFVLQQNVFSTDQNLGPLARLRGAGFLSDPNDFAQILIMALPLVYIAWRRGRGVTNSLIVLVPTALLLWAIYLTHSRGALIALAVLVLVATQEKLGTTASAGLTVALVLGMLALNFTGGRAISAAEGADRLEAWSIGLQLFKHAPLFGTGFSSFTEFSDITAHNSFILCLAELGLVGSTIWLALLVTTVTGLNGMADREEAAPTSIGNVDDEDHVFPPEDEPTFHESFATTTTATVAAGEVETRVGIAPAQQYGVPKHWVLSIRLALFGFITTSWFLSRTYSTPTYLILGLATATIALQRPAIASAIGSRSVFYTLAVEMTLIASIYGVVRFRH